MANSPIFSKLFGRSPIAPMQEHMKLACQCARELPAFFELTFTGDWDAARRQVELISKLESDADRIKSEIRKSLPRGLFLPVSRSDLLELLHIQDKIPNMTKDISGLMFGRHMTFPASMAQSVREYVVEAVSTTDLALQALEELDELIISGFSGSEIEQITRMVEGLDQAEHQTDLKQIEVRNLLLALEKELNPVDVMFMYRIIDWIGDISDDAQTVGNRLLYLIAR
jgi:uncharacterized protein